MYLLFTCLSKLPESTGKATTLTKTSLTPHDLQGKYEEAMKEIKVMHAKVRGIIAMKLCGNGHFTNGEDRENAVRHAFKCGIVDAMVIGFKSPAEVDEAIEYVNRTLGG